ncbi:FAD-binding oxidoreductase [Nocardiopsis mangrovi]|uniref:FAD-binding oxidoreductase n=1 Tax=Nocardiopsis mangrovi TaxID=1179818 RepID=A0ABV9E5F0_9ACTN
MTTPEPAVAGGSAGSGTAYARAVREWRAVLGDAHVHTDRDTLDRAGAATYHTGRRPVGVIRPGSRDEVRACLRIAARHRVPVYPVSTGRNWGYGSAVPVRDGCVLMPLSRMDRITDFDERLAYATVEPGVTQRQLHDFLREHGSRLTFSTTGSTPDSSLMGNVLERGLGEGRNGDRFSHVCGMEVVLATGERLCTGFSGHPKATTGPLHRWGVGPWLDGLFTQSNLGVVTRMTLWLTPLPARATAFTFRAAPGPALAAVVDAVRGLRLHTVLNSGFVIANDIREIAARQQYPWDLAGGRTPLPDAVRQGLRRTWDVGAWNGEGVLHAAGDRHADALRGLVADALGGRVADLRFRETDPAAAGAPTERHLAMAYWRGRTPPPAGGADLDRDRCGLIWACPTMPLDGAHVTAAVHELEKIAAEHGFEPNIGLNSACDRTLVATAAIAYDRQVPGEDARALSAYEETQRRMAAAGYPSYRLSTHAMAHAPPTDDDRPAVLHRLKTALDPADVLSPGRYDLRHMWPGPAGDPAAHDPAGAGA